MSESKKNVHVTEGPQTEVNASLNSLQQRGDKLKKPVIFSLLGIAFIGCLFLIFKPSTADKENEQIGLNDAVPQATEAGMQSDKQKAYEQELLLEKQQEKKQSLMNLSDYWNEELGDKSASGQVSSNAFAMEQATSKTPVSSSINSYRNTQDALSSFYHADNSYETQELKKELEVLKSQLLEKETPAVNTVESQLALMEKSYQMAAKYLPTTDQRSLPTDAGEIADKGPKVPIQKVSKETFMALSPKRKDRVSSLYREQSDSVFLETITSERNRGFYTVGAGRQVVQPKNSIKAVIQHSQTISSQGVVQIRLLEDVQTSAQIISKGTVLTALAKFQGSRLQLSISSIEYEGNILPVELTVYDIDGQMGLQVPYSPEINALSEMAGNMSQQSGTSLMMTSSAGQQIAADLSRGLVQGVSGYFSKKVRTPKVTVKAGHQLFLVSKK